MFSIKILQFTLFNCISNEMSRANKCFVSIFQKSSLKTGGTKIERKSIAHVVKTFVSFELEIWGNWRIERGIHRTKWNLSVYFMRYTIIKGTTLTKLVPKLFHFPFISPLVSFSPTSVFLAFSL